MVTSGSVGGFPQAWLYRLPLVSAHGHYPLPPSCMQMRLCDACQSRARMQFCVASLLQPPTPTLPPTTFVHVPFFLSAAPFIGDFWKLPKLWLRNENNTHHAVQTWHILSFGVYPSRSFFYGHTHACLWASFHITSHLVISQSFFTFISSCLYSSFSPYT